MNTASGATVAVLATSAGDGLVRSLGAFAPVARRILVVDPVGCARAAAVRHRAVLGTDPALREGPVLAVLEGETPTPELAEALAAGDVGGAARVRVRHVGLGWELEPRGGSPRYGAWSVERFGLGDARATFGRPMLPGALVAEHGDVESALARVDAVAAALAALLDHPGATVGMTRTARAAASTGLRALAGRAPRRLGWGRWIGAALLAYGELLAYTKVVERRGRA